MSLRHNPTIKMKCFNIISTPKYIVWLGTISMKSFIVGKKAETFVCGI